MDASGDRFRDYVEVSGCILKGDNSIGEFIRSGDKQLSAGGYGNKDDPPGEEHA
jgi:hypothetical protein